MEHEQDKQTPDFSPSQAHQQFQGTLQGSGATNSPKTLSADESAQLAGVSLDTIEKYIAIGLLTPVSTSSAAAQARFLESDIRSLFYTRRTESSRSYDKDLPPTSSELASTVDPSVEETTSSQHGERDADEGTIPHQATPEIPESAPIEADAQAQQQAAEPEKIEDWAMKEALQAASSTAVKEAVTTSFEESSQSESADASSAKPVERELEAETLTKSLREQIEVLKEERDWLRTRIEQLELRSEREQMLLLSESETVRRLVSQRSIAERVMHTFRLPWLQSEKK